MEEQVKLSKKIITYGFEWLTVSFTVFLLYQMMWYMIYNEPSIYFNSPHFVVDRIKDFGLLLIFCGISLIFAHMSVRLAKQINAMSLKMILLSVGLLIFNTLWAYTFTIILNNLFSEDGGFADPVDTYGLAISSTLVLSLLFTARYVRAFVKEERLRNLEKVVVRDAIIENLQLQISPHFLFNNLSTLSALIDEDKERANDFLMHLSLFYRHTLQNMPSRLIPVDTELKQLEDYIFLLKTRFGSSVEISVSRNYESGNRTGLLPPGTIQLLVENCIKHNRFSKRSPMRIEIICENDNATVRNDYRPISQDEISTSIGHENIKKRYLLLERPGVEIRHDEKHYIVTIPLIQPK